ncbi:MAG TPA: hypothetical protein VGP90_08840 [Acidimicrobiia bacterium]|nr:hypothetical protein [Acidimicrobiia bacterium]
MRFEELAYRDGGQAVTIPFHRTMTVLGGLDADLRRRFADRAVASLGGHAAGYGVSLVFVDGSGSRVHLVRDPRGGTTVTDLDSGEDLAESLADGAGRIDWLRLVGLASPELLLFNPVHFERDSARPQGPSSAAPPDNDELAEARAVLAQVEEEYQQVVGRHRRVDELRLAVARLDDEIRHTDERAARRRFDDAARTVARLEAELALLRGAEPAERRQAEAAVAAVRLAADRRAATEALHHAQEDFGERRRLDQRALARALGLPAEMPADLERLQAEFLAASRRRAELVARLDADAASDLPAPSAPWVITLARQPHPAELWARAERATAARTRAAELSMGLGGSGRHGDLVAEIESVHQVVEEAEREVAGARIKALAMAAKRRLAQAQEAEQAVLARAGFVSWLAFQMRRIDVLLEPDAVEAMRVAELEHQVAAVAWAELAGDVDPEAALAARAEIERYAAEMADAEHLVETTELLHRELAEDAEPACNAARAALLEACRSFDVEPEHAVSEVAAIVSEARHARLQRTLEDAEAAHHRIESDLERELAAAGRPGPGHLAERLEAVTALASAAALHLEAAQSTRSPEEVEADLVRARAVQARLARPEWEHLPAPPAFDFSDAGGADGEGHGADSPEPADGRDPIARLTEERVRLLADADAAGRGLPDVGRLADRREALSRRVTILESSAGTGPLLVTAEEAEMVLLGRFAQTRRVGPEAEPVPVLVDDALAAFPRHEKWRLLDLLARLGEASQVVYLTDDEETIDWARSRAVNGGVGLLAPAPEEPEVAASV